MVEKLMYSTKYKKPVWKDYCSVPIIWHSGKSTAMKRWQDPWLGGGRSINQSVSPSGANNWINPPVRLRGKHPAEPCGSGSRVAFLTEGCSVTSFSSLCWAKDWGWEWTSSQCRSPTSAASGRLSRHASTVVATFLALALDTPKTWTPRLLSTFPKP